MAHPIIVLGQDNSSLPFCDTDCYQIFAFYQECFDQVGAKKLHQSPHNCFHCAACGRLVYGSSNCLMHDDEGCPDWLWYVSYPTTFDFIDTYITNVGKMVPDAAYDLADLIAEHNSLISGSELAILTIKRLNPEIEIEE
jgi:hypothetical protein